MLTRKYFVRFLLMAICSCLFIFIAGYTSSCSYASKTTKDAETSNTIHSLNDSDISSQKHEVKVAALWRNTRPGQQELFVPKPGSPAVDYFGYPYLAFVVDKSMFVFFDCAEGYRPYGIAFVDSSIPSNTFDSITNKGIPLSFTATTPTKPSFFLESNLTIGGKNYNCYEAVIDIANTRTNIPDLTCNAVMEKNAQQIWEQITLTRDLLIIPVDRISAKTRNMCKQGKVKLLILGLEYHILEPVL